MESVKLLLFALGDHAALVLEHKVMAADDDLLAVHAALNTVRNDVFDLRVPLLMVQPASLSLRDNGLGHRVRVVLLKACGKTKYLVLLLAVEGDDRRDLRPHPQRRTFR